MTPLTFTARLWMYTGKGAWYFLTLPPDLSDTIKFMLATPKRGWGSVPVTARIGQTEWTTSIFPDTKAGAYLLPVKAEVRKKQKLVEGDQVEVALSLT